MNKISEKVTAILKEGKFKIIIFVGILGIILIFLSEFIGTEEKSNLTDNEKASFSSYENYVQDMEGKLKKILEKIEGVGKAEVMITVGGTEEYIYAQEEKIKNGDNDFSSEKQYVMIGSGSEKHALLKKIVNPEIKGVVIICEGGDSNIVKEKVYNSISAVFNLSAGQIYVAKLK